MTQQPPQTAQRPARVLIATPVRGANPESACTTLGYQNATRQLARDPNVDIMVAGFGCDLVRSRSRMVRMALETDAWTHILWWDDDVIPQDVQAVHYMIQSGHDLVAAPYPRKRIHWDRVAKGMGQMPDADPEAFAYEYPMLLQGDVARQFHKGCADIDHIAMGFMLTTTSMLRKMWDAYASKLSFGDVIDGHKHWTVAMFQLLMPEQSPVPPYAVGPLWSEDYSFCIRAREQGFKPQLYLGPGAPCHHVGGTVFRGVREGVVG